VVFGPRLFFCYPKLLLAGGKGVPQCGVFNTFKERGEWVEMRFMAEAMGKGFRVLKPWGDSAEYDIGVEWRERILRVQVKSTDFKMQYGFLCTFKASPGVRYHLKHVEFFAAYIIPADAWYILPARLLLGSDRKGALVLCPENPRSPERYQYEGFREAWRLMKGVKGQQSWLKKMLGEYGALSKLPTPVRRFARTIPGVASLTRAARERARLLASRRSKTTGRRRIAALTPLAK
jgi:hypothetical protein